MKLSSYIAVTIVTLFSLLSSEAKAQTASMSFMYNGKQVLLYGNSADGYYADEFELVEGVDFDCPVDFVARKFSYNRMATPEYEYSTLMLPAEIPLEAINASVYTFLSVGGTSLHCILVDETYNNGCIKAHVPFMLGQKDGVNAGDKLVMDGLENIKVFSTSNIYEEGGWVVADGDCSNSVLGKVQFAGRYIRNENIRNSSGATVCFFSKGNFYYLLDTQKMSLNPYRAIFKLEDFSGGNVKISLLPWSTDVKAVTMQQVNNANVYSINGVQLRTNVSEANALDGLAPGLYIVGGKKMMKR